MKRMNSWSRWLTLLSCAAVLLLMGASQDHGGRKLYLAQVSKGANLPHFARMATQLDQLIVSPRSVASATQEIAIEEPMGMRLYLVEPGPAPIVGTLPGELASMAVRGIAGATDAGRVHVVAVPRGVDPHAYFGRHDVYAVGVERELVVPEPRFAEMEWPIRGGRVASADLLSELDTAWYEEKLRVLSGADQFQRTDGTLATIRERGSQGGRELAREYLAQEFTQLGYVVRNVPYGDAIGGQALLGGVNLVAERLAEQTDGLILVTAHYDSVGNAGADDDASGVIAALGAAKVLADLPLRYGVRFLAFDQEERGLIGSRAYVQQLRDRDEIDQVVAVLNVEMTGFDGDNDSVVHAIHCNEGRSAEISEVFVAAMNEFDESMSVRDACTNRSDHASFWRADRPAIVVSQNFFGGDSNPCYHARCDQVDEINWDYLTRLSRVIAATAIQLAAAPTP